MHSKFPEQVLSCTQYLRPLRQYDVQYKHLKRIKNINDPLFFHRCASRL